MPEPKNTDGVTMPVLSLPGTIDFLAALQNELPELPEYTRLMIKALELAIAEHLRERRRG